jgi:diacylglycerol O-acyltransferase
MRLRGRSKAILDFGQRSSPSFCSTGPRIGTSWSTVSSRSAEGCRRSGPWGINVDTGAIPDFDVFYDCLVAGFDEVLALAD